MAWRRRRAVPGPVAFKYPAHRPHALTLCVSYIHSVPNPHHAHNTMDREFDDAANWTGRQVGGVEGDARRFDNDVRDEYRDTRQDFRDTRQDVDNFGRDAREDVDDFGRDTRQGFDQFGREARQDVDNFGREAVQGVENAPYNAARWAGDEVGSAERDVKDVGEGIVGAIGGAIGWAARKAEGVERFGDNVEGSYDQGKQEGEREGGW
ncbi:uncharacterized protein B0H18DRAFT_992472 [Fomitopsis serialis]|uniref:uncharacterized protein n=1 Tax=Fomitopsis serialis TaxID=139415 RepID=UPI002007E9C7|nr:uncharacterized protein B0H18DRAFT_992472 [Neoantrodia serialis]KAH9930609.1 hypothetical protein B0H18DRAFT_992472 [Neoantrodia serialis]